LVVEKLELECPEADRSEWDRVVAMQQKPKNRIKLAMVGKYMDLIDAYKSLNEAIMHAGIHTHAKVEVEFVDSEDVETKGVGVLKDADAILVPGGFGERGFEGKILAARYARENKIPYLGICYGLHAAIIDFARNVAGLEDANSTEVDPGTPHPVIALITEWITDDGRTEVRDEASDLGGTMRMGEQECILHCDSLTSRIYGESSIRERHRHRFEVNETYVEQLEKAGLRIAGRSKSDQSLVEVIELDDHPWFVACQFHPEFTSTPRDGHPLFTSFITAAIKKKNIQPRMTA
ncbi:MAG: CTP synthase, partial [Pseudomonadales bacterium]|nr:CTP synthase [Pseudomonadales bacterium]